MKPLRKYDLPLVGEFNKNIDLYRMRDELYSIMDHFVDVEAANPSLCDNHADLVRSVYDSFEQINLTTLGEQQPMEFTGDVKKRIRRREEALYNQPTEIFKGSYFEQITSMFSAPAIRVRITKLQPGKEVPFHIDYDPTYAVRVIVPIFTNPRVVNKFICRGEESSCYLKPGHAYFLNTGFAHSVYNGGFQPRIAMMFSLDGQDDLADIRYTS